MKQLKLSFIHFLCCFLMFFAFSCGDSQMESKQREYIDSLENANFQSKMDYDNLQRHLGVIAEGLDSISLEEGELIINSNGVESSNINRQRMLHKLSHIREVLERHRDRIAELENSLDDTNKAEKQLKVIIASLKQQLDAKEEELSKLKIELESSKKNIAHLNELVSNLGSINNTQSEAIKEQKDIIDKQNAELNKVYLKIGTKKELKKLGLISSALLRKTKVDYSNIDLSVFKLIDKRTTSTIEIPSKGKILTPVPVGSYTINNNNDNTKTITITNPEKFWGTSIFLIIQTD